jgi:hypothetical protein
MLPSSVCSLKSVKEVAHVLSRYHMSGAVKRCQTSSCCHMIMQRAELLELWEVKGAQPAPLLPRSWQQQVLYCRPADGAFLSAPPQQAGCPWDAHTTHCKHANRDSATHTHTHTHNTHLQGVWRDEAAGQQGPSAPRVDIHPESQLLHTLAVEQVGAGTDKGSASVRGRCITHCMHSKQANGWQHREGEGRTVPQA